MRKILIVLLSLIFITCIIDIPSSAAGTAVPPEGFSISVSPGKSGSVTVSVSAAYRKDSWSVWYSADIKGKYIGYNNLSAKISEYDIKNLEPGTTYYFYAKLKLGAKEYTSKTYSIKTPGYSSMGLFAFDNHQGSVMLIWDKFLTPQTISVWYSTNKTSGFKGLKNVKPAGASYVLNVLGFSKTYYIKLTTVYKGRTYTSETVSIMTDAAKNVVSRASDLDTLVGKTTAEKKTSFSAVFSKASLYLDEAKMMKKYGCFAGVDVTVCKKDGGATFAIYNFKYKNYPNILFAYYTKNTSFLTANAKSNYNAAKKIISSQITAKMTDKEKVKAIHDYIVNNTVYDMKYYEKGNVPESSCRITGVLRLGKAVYSGYTETFALLMDMIGINNLTVSGTAKGYKGITADHSWNMVELGGKWYHIDAASDDPIGDKDKLRYDYYLITDKKIKKDHFWDSKNYPKADGKTKYTAAKSSAFVKTSVPEIVYLDIGEYIYSEV